MSRAYRARHWMVGVVVLLAAAGFAARLPRLAVVLHGLNSNVHVFSTTDPGLSLIRGLRAQGWEVIVPEEPYASDDAFVRADIRGDGGFGYRNRWDATFAADVLAVGSVSEIMVVGISWGGLLAFMAACDDSAVTALVVHMPVVKASNLTELSGLSLPGLNLSACVPRLCALTGQLSYGTLDTRVGVAPSVALGRMISSRTMRVIAEREGHSTTAADVALMLSSSRVDPGRQVIAG